MVLRGFTQNLLRWPVLAVVFTILGFEFLGYLLVRGAVHLYECGSRFRFRREKRALADATDFVTWCAAARDLDRCEGRDEWKRKDESPFFDYQLVRGHLAQLEHLRATRNFDRLLSLLKQILQNKNVGGINNSQLYSETHFGTKSLINAYIQAILEAMIVLRDAEELPLQTRRDFFRRARRWYGRTALMLSGGAAMAYFHIGTLKTLIEAKCMPQIISGASGGSLISAFIAVRTDAEVLRDLCVPESERFFRACEEPFCVKLARWARHGYAFDKDRWIELMRTGVTKGDTTFLEAYQRYGRVINFAVTATSKYAPTLLLNYRSTPDVVIWSGVLASSAFPNFLEPIELQLKNPRTGLLEPFHVHGQTFTDGTIKNDIPIKEMAKLWNANYFIVSQVNPHVTPLLHGGARPAGPRSRVSSGLRGGFVLSMLEKLLKLDIKKWFKLIADMDLLPLVFGADWRFIYLQKLTGTVTIVPDAPLWAYFRILSDPNRSRMASYILTGEKATWYKLCRISNHFRLEKTLVECLRHLDERAQRLGIQVTRERISHVNAGVTVKRANGDGGVTTTTAAEGEDVPSGASADIDTNGGVGIEPIVRLRRSTKKKKKAAPTRLHHVFGGSSSTNNHGDVVDPDQQALDAARAQAYSYSQVDPAPSPPSRGISSGDDGEEVGVSLEPDALGPGAYARAHGEVARTATEAILDADISFGTSTWRRGLDTDTDTDLTDEEEEASRVSLMPHLARTRTDSDDEYDDATTTASPDQQETN